MDMRTPSIRRQEQANKRRKFSQDSAYVPYIIQRLCKVLGVASASGLEAVENDIL